MKIKISELRQLIREEITGIVEGPNEDDMAYQKIMQMITAALGDSPETKKMGSDLHGAFQTKKTDVQGNPTQPVQQPVAPVAPQQQQAPQQNNTVRQPGQR